MIYRTKNDIQGHVTTGERSGSAFDDSNPPITPITTRGETSLRLRELRLQSAR
jgi:hypothetical protein